MKKIWYIILAVVLFLALAGGGILIHSRKSGATAGTGNNQNAGANALQKEKEIVIYSTSGESKTILESEFESYGEEWGLEPFVEMYSVYGEVTYAPQSQVEEYKEVGWLLERPDWEGLADLKAQIEAAVPTASWGIFVQNLDTNEYLVINEKPFVSASIVKLFTMATTYSEIEAGNIEKTETVQNNLTSMITVSSNEACNYLTRLNGGGSEGAGYDKENELAAGLGCENTVRGSYIVDTSGRKGLYRTQNKTSPRDCGRLLKAIYNKELVSEAASEEMLSLLLSQTRVWKIPAALPEGTKVANKTGETNKVNSDVAIVFSEGADYILCMLGNGSKAPGVGTIHTVSKMVYDYFNN